MPAPKDPQKYEEWKQKLSEANKGKSHWVGRTHSPETRAKISAIKKGNQYMLGHKHTPESLAKMSASHTGYKTSEETRAKLSIASSKLTHSEETKARISAHHKGLGHTPETKAKLSAIVKAHYASMTPEEQGASNEKRLKAVRNKDTDLEAYIARQFDKEGIAYEQQKRVGRYVVDFLIADQNLIVECNGCWWHGCEKCGYSTDEHMKRREHDSKRIAFLEKAGYTVTVLWQHDLTPLMRAEAKD